MNASEYQHLNAFENVWMFMNASESLYESLNAFKAFKRSNFDCL